jgi:hypothetical protein
MANNLESNITLKLAKKFTEKVESTRVLSKNVNTQFLNNAFNASTGDEVGMKRPTDFKTIRTTDGDVTAETASPIIVGQAKGKVQDYITVFVEYDEIEEALKLDQLDELLAPAATRMVTDLELDYASFMMKNSALKAGNVGSPVAAWSDVAEASAVMAAHGVPAGDWMYTVNPFTQTKLADNQRGLGSSNELISQAHRAAIISDNYAGMKVMQATTLSTYSTGAGSDRSGTLAVSPTVTYAAHKDSMVQSLVVTGFNANLVVKAGETVTIAGRKRLNLSTRKLVINGDGNEILYSGVVTEDVTLDGSGAGTLLVSGPAIYEADGAYNTVDSAPTSGDVVTLGGAASSIYQPNLFWHKNAFSIGSVPIKKLHSTDTLAKTADGLQIRVSKGSDFKGNSQMVRFDLHPAFGVMNPFFAGQGFGV